MKNILTITFVLLCTFSFGQKKIKFNKDIYPLISSEQFKEVKPILRNFLEINPNNLKANYWLGIIYYGNTIYHDNDIKQNNAEIKSKYYNYIDSSKFYLAKTKKLVNVATLNPISSRFFPDFNGLSSEELIIDAIAKIDKWQIMLNDFSPSWKILEANREKERLLLEKYKSIDCEYEDEDDYMVTTCRWGEYIIQSKYNRRSGSRDVEVYLYNLDYDNKLLLFDEIYHAYDDASRFFEQKFKTMYNELMSENESCFENNEFFFDLSLVYIIDGDTEGLTFAMGNRGVLNHCRNRVGESSIKISFDDILPFVKLK